jgi:hypothetical protein
MIPKGGSHPRPPIKATEKPIRINRRFGWCGMLKTQAAAAREDVRKRMSGIGFTDAAKREGQRR